jgi:hypothetical protein
MHAIGVSWRVSALSLVWLGTSESRTSLARRLIGCYEAADRIAAQYRRDEHAHDT